MDLQLVQGDPEKKKWVMIVWWMDLLICVIYFLFIFLSSYSFPPGDPDVNPTCDVIIHPQLVFPAHLGSAVSVVCHPEEEWEWGNVQAQRRGEETAESSGAWEARPAFTVTQSRAPHIRGQALWRLCDLLEFPSDVCRYFSIVTFSYVTSSILSGNKCVKSLPVSI